MDDFTKRFIEDNGFEIRKDSYAGDNSGMYELLYGTRHHNGFEIRKDSYAGDNSGMYELLYGTRHHNTLIRFHKEHINQLIDLLTEEKNKIERG